MMKNQLKLLNITLLLLSFNMCVFSQEFCSTPSNIPDFLQTIPPEKYVSSSVNDTYTVRVFFHIIKNTDGTGGHTLLEVNTAFDILNMDYQPYGICFELLGIDETSIDKWAFAEDGNGKFTNLPNPHYNAIDIYLAIDFVHLSFSGWAAGIPATAFILNGKGSSLSHIISHEMGHCLGLFHTFHGFPCCEEVEDTCEELLDGSNCEICGDYVCDTPPDPQQHKVDKDSCVWNGTTCCGGSDTIPNQRDSYNPRTDLYMAYTPSSCMQIHTPGQVARMKAMMANHPMLQKVEISNEFILSGEVSGTNEYTAIETIASTQIINSGSTSYQAGSEIILQDGFHAQKGSDFHAYISSTNYSCDEKNLYLYHDQENEESHDHSHSATLQTHQNLSLQEVIQNRKITIHPNPNNGSFTIDANFPLTDIGNLKITNLMGATVYETQKVASNTVQLQNPAKGTFFVVMILKDGSVLTRKMVVQ